MKIIIIKTQSDLDSLPDKFEEFTRIQIEATAGVTIRIRKAWENSSVVAWGNSSVVALENSSVEARGNSSVVALGNSSVVAWGNSSVETWENSSVVAWENSSVVAWGNSSVVALGNSVIRLFNQIKRLVLKKFSVAISIGFTAKVEFKAETATYIEKPLATYDKAEFLDIYAKNIQPDGRILLYKSTLENGTDHHTGKIKYEGIVHPAQWDPDENRQCGDGLHLSPTPQLAKSYNSGKIKQCLVKVDNFVVYPYDITKVRCAEVEVIEEDPNA